MVHGSNFNVPKLSFESLPCFLAKHSLSGNDKEYIKQDALFSSKSLGRETFVMFKIPATSNIQIYTAPYQESFAKKVIQSV